MKILNLGLWIAIGTGIGAAFGAGGALMGPPVAYGVAAGAIAALLISNLRQRDNSSHDG